MFLGEDIAILGSKNKPELPDDDRLTGTSFAAPIAAATAALVLYIARLEASKFSKVERCLKTCEGMSTVFQAMSEKPTKGWMLSCNVIENVGPKERPTALESGDETIQWYSLTGVAECLRRFGNVHEQLD